MKRYVNFRPLLLTFVSLIGGIYSCISAMLGRFLPLAFCLAFLVLFFILFVLSLCKKDFGKNISEFFGVKKFSFIFVCLIVGVFFGAGISSVSFCINNNREFENGNYQCSGLVSEIVEDESGCSILVKEVSALMVTNL